MALALFIASVDRITADKTKISTDQLGSWSLLGEFRAALEEVAPGPPLRSRSPGGPIRLLTEEDYLCGFLFAQLNPILDSARGLCEASKLEAIQQRVCSRPISLASFSEAQSVFGCERLEKIFERLVSDKLRLASGGPAGSGPDGGAAKQARCLQLVDSSVFLALPRMYWAEWRSQYSTRQSAVRLHLKFNLFERMPEEVRITNAKVCERKAFADMIKPGEFYVGDRNYGRSYKLLSGLDEAGCGYIMRLCANAEVTVIEELEIDEEDRAAGVVSDQLVRLGSRERWHYGPVRLVRIEKPDMDEPLLLISNRIQRDTFSAALIAEIYWQRWGIELFFRWFKCVLGRPAQWHWFAESERGVAIQIYCSLIAALLLSRRLGKLPNKRTMEMLRFYFAGVASREELARFLGQQSAGAKKRS